MCELTLSSNYMAFSLFIIKDSLTSTSIDKLVQKLTSAQLFNINAPGSKDPISLITSMFVANKFERVISKDFEDAGELIPE